MRRIVRRTMAACAVVVTALVLVAAPVAAAGEAVVSRDGSVVTVPQMTWQLLTGVLAPIVVGLVTKAAASTPLKVVVNLVVAAVAGVIGTVTIIDGVAVLSTATVGNALTTLVVSIAMHYGLWKPLGVTGSEPTMGVLAPQVGLG